MGAPVAAEGTRRPCQAAGAAPIFPRWPSPPDSSRSFAPASRSRRSSGGRSPGIRARAIPPRATTGRPVRSIRKSAASFHVDEAKGYYYCFGCHAKGDAVTFVRETENLGFMEAVELLAREAGMAMPARDPAEAARAAANQGLAEAMEAAVRFFRLQLATARATEARAYLDRRGMSAAIRDRFEIGYAPEARTALLDHLTGKGFAAGEARRGRARRRAAGRRQPVRPLPQPDHLPDPRRAAAAASPSARGRSPRGRSRST